MVRRLARIVLIMALATVLATAALASPAVAQPTLSARLAGTATLVAKGAAVEVPVIYSCAVDATSAGINIQVTQRIGGGRLAQGFGSVSDLICDATEHTAVITVTASGANAFRRGDALVQGFFSACSPETCSTINLSETIRIVGK
jgi:hypothetical protein